MKNLINICLTLFYWIIFFNILKRLKIKNIYKSFILLILFIIYFYLYYIFFLGVFNYYNYLIIIFTFIYIFIYK